jgi:hypothetical protein
MKNCSKRSVRRSKKKEISGNGEMRKIIYKARTADGQWYWEGLASLGLKTDSTRSGNL